MRASALLRGENIVIDGSLSWGPLAQQYVGELLDAGYDSTTVISVEIGEELAVERTRERWWAGRKEGEPGGRFVPEAVVRACFDTTEASTVRNAMALVDRARDELGTGELIRYKVNPRTGEAIRVRDD